jgi:hypothetical protein
MGGNNSGGSAEWNEFSKTFRECDGDSTPVGKTRDVKNVASGVTLYIMKYLAP